MISNSSTLAVATEKGIELHDLNRLISDYKFESDVRYLDNGEVLQI
jgi:hypothetical protein